MSSTAFEQNEYGFILFPQKESQDVISVHVLLMKGPIIPNFNYRVVIPEIKNFYV